MSGQEEEELEEDDWEPEEFGVREEDGDVEGHTQFWLQHNSRWDGLCGFVV